MTRGRSHVSRYGLIFAVASAACFGFSGPLAKALISAGIGPLQVVWIRLGGSAVVLFCFTAAANRRALVVSRARRRFVLAYSLVGFAAVQAFYYATVARLAVGIAILLEYLSVGLVVAWVRLVRRVQLPRSAMVGAVLAVIGLACVVEFWRGLRVDPLGLLFGIGTAGCAAAYFLLSQNAGDGVHPLGSLSWGTLGATLVLIPLARPWQLPWDVLGGQLTLGPWSVPAVVALSLLILVATVAAYAASIAALRRLTAAIGATVASLEAVATVLIAWLLLGETLGGLQLAGGGIVLAGAFLAQRAMAGPRGRPATYSVGRTPRGDVPAGKCLRTYDDSHTLGEKH